ncbi:ABC-type branched-chain amino acid transport system, substrate-binding protein [Halomicrobium zhouii]|uniref:ABC-type branched-chain amino acid transport system, substrate-binding protein n=1 Tax=Halomicrobium zhouii TaxID=767519 RepID=A0A1I6KP28_9EURY|nr:ABC transporter substrate-binding protein [Halomicrobium zhouii]SFR92748.1 ABC-type branched-chain amino acid transport system, substrate-binding protein [Halomicrobium zhouii]
MEREERHATGGTTSRRRLLETIAAGSAAGLGGLAGCISDGSGGTPTPDSAPTFLLSTVQSGPYSRLGDKELNGFELAVKHINEGGGLVEAGAFEELTGDGLLGYEVETTTVDNEGSGETARSNVLPHVTENEVTMICGGARASTARAHRDIAIEHEVPFMAGTCLLDALSGEECAATMYREMYSSRALVRALGPTLATRVGERATYVQLYADSPEGKDLRNAVDRYFADSGTPRWEPRGNEAIQPGSTGYEDDLAQITRGRPDALFLNLFGIDAINALTAAQDAVPEETQVVVPFIDDSLGYVVGSEVADILGTMPWEAGLDGEYAKAYDSAYVSNYGTIAGGDAATGSGTAHVTYTQTLQFAAAAARAESFDPGAIQSALEGYEYDAGGGDQRLQACNHQASRAVPVVRGRSSQDSGGNYFELLDHRDGVVPTCEEEPATSCSL